jgi:hypothetical protein
MLKRTQKGIQKVERALAKSLEGVMYARAFLRMMPLDTTATKADMRQARSKVNKLLSEIAKTIKSAK